MIQSNRTGTHRNTYLTSCLGVALSVGMCFSAFGAPRADEPANSGKVGIYEPWDVLQDKLSDRSLGANAFVRPAGGRQAILDMGKIQTLLAGAPQEAVVNNPAALGVAPAPVVIALPKPDGSFERFEVVEYSIMEPELAAQFPEFKTYIGTSIDSPQSEARIDVTSLGFRAQVLSVEGSYWIDPVTMGDTNLYTSYRKSDLVRDQAWTCHFDELPENHVAPADQNPFGDRTATGTTRRDFRTAVAATGEYTAFFGGTVAQGLAAVTSLINRITGVYEKDFSVRLVLVANETSVIYTNAATDPYNNTASSGQLTTNTTNLNAVIGSANYDVGHLVTTDPGGGIAGLGVICGASKGAGATGLSSPTGDAFAIDYVAHELGHQFGGNHTFNSGVCAANRNAATSVEPGSGITIMAYAGICGGDDLAAHSVDFFHARSIQEITIKVSAVSCYATVGTGNNIPTVSAGSAFTIPKQTPYTLTGTGSDADGDAITFCWEQNITSSAAQTASGGNFPDVGTNAYQRSFNPVSSPSRTFPNTAALLANTLTKGETLPNTSRAIPYRLTVRDGKGGQNFADVSITSTTLSGPFLVTSPNTAVSYAGLSTQTVTWNVANTTAAPVNCANVDILLSTNGGNTFPTTLASAVPNNGSANVTIPNTATTTARIMVKANGNIFFDISNVNFTITAAAVPPADPTSPLATPGNVCPGGNSSLSVANPGAGIVIDWYTGSCGGSLVGTGNPFVVSPGATTTYFARARRSSDNVVSTGCASVAVTVNPNPVAPSGASSDLDNLCQYDSGNIVLTATGGSGTTLRWFTGSCGGSLVGTGNGLSIPSPAVSTTYYARWENSCGVSSCASVLVTVRSCPADFNCDTFVEDADFVIFANAYDIFDCSDMSMPAGCPADINGDGFVEDADFVLFANAYDFFFCP